MNEELLKKAKEAKDEKELIEIAEKEGIELREEAASSIFKRLHSEGELSDDDLDSVSGGGCQQKINNHNFTVVTSGCSCFTGHWKDSRANSDRYFLRSDNTQLRETWYAFSSPGKCGTCAYLEFNVRNSMFINGIGFCGLSGTTNTNKEDW